MILLNSAILFIVSFDDIPGVRYLHYLDFALTVFFACEIGYKLWYYGVKGEGGYFKDGWRIFDFIVVAISLPSLVEIFLVDSPGITFLLLFRLLRVSRAFRLMRFVPNIDRLLSGLKRAFKASAFVFLGIGIYNFLLAVLSCQLFREVAPDYFGNPLISYYSIFQIFTIEGWNDIPDTIAAGSGFWSGMGIRLYFIGVVFTGGIIGFSIVNAIFVDEMTFDNTEEVETRVEELHKKVDRLMELLEEKKRSDGKSGSVGGRGEIEVAEEGKLSKKSSGSLKGEK